ncbi:MAG: type II secretion system protein, partial [Nitrososphaera sp.]
MQRQPGFTLVEMAFVLVIIGLLAAGALRAVSAMRENTGITETRKAVDTIVMALQTFLINNNRLPCPADPILAETAANYGLEARTAPNCDAATLVVGSTNAHRGVLPVRTLGLVRFVDAWYRQFTYEVTLQATQDDSFTSGTWPTQFDLLDEWGIDLNPAGDGVVVIMSHGTNGNGAFTTDGIQLPGPPVTAVNELANLDNDFVFSSATYSSDTANPFDDLVLILTEEQIVEPLADRGVLKNKLTQVREKLERIDSATFSFMIGDVYD